MTQHTSKYDVQIMIVSEQAAANLLPALDPRYKPKNALLIVTKKMKTKADYLSKVLKSLEIKVDTVDIDNERDITAIQSKVLEQLPASQARVGLNLTGGTKLLAFALREIADNNWASFYLDLDSSELVFLHEKNFSSDPVQAELKLTHYMQSYGFQPTEKQKRPAPNTARQDQGDEIVRCIAEFKEAIGTLNFYCQDAKKRKNLKVQIQQKHRDSISLRKLLECFAKAHALTWTTESITFTSDDDWQYVAGGWLEEHVYRTVETLTGPLKIQDKYCNWRLQAPDQDKNKDDAEIDVVFLCNNRPYIIECKTANLQDKAQDVLHKLSNNCRRLAGHSGKSMLVSYRPLSDAEKRLAQALNINVVDGGNIKRLDEKIKEWVNNS